MTASASMAEADAGFDVDAPFIRATVELRFVHAVEHGAVNFAPAAGVEDAGDAAHGVLRFCGTDRRLRSRPALSSTE